jgi:hypothetical protein
LGSTPPSVNERPPWVENEEPVRLLAAVRNSKVFWESLEPTATLLPWTAMVVSLWVV